MQVVYGPDGQPVRPDSKRGRAKGKTAAGNTTPTTGVSDNNYKKLTLSYKVIVSKTMA